jgi:hypothetical protein
MPIRSVRSPGMPLHQVDRQGRLDALINQIPNVVAGSGRLSKWVDATARKHMFHKSL